MEKYFPEPLDGKQYSEGEEAVIKLISDLVDIGQIPEEGAHTLALYAWARMEADQVAFERNGPDPTTPADIMSMIEAAEDATTSTVYVREGGRTYLYSSVDRSLLSVSDEKVEAASVEDIGFYVELFAEILLLLVSAFGGPRGQSVRDAANEHARQLAGRLRVREILRRLFRALDPVDPATGSPVSAGRALKRIGQLLSELFSEIGAALRDFVTDVFRNLSGWGIAMLVVEMFVFFLPFGWARRGVQFFAGLAGLTGSLISKTQEPA